MDNVNLNSSDTRIAATLCGNLNYFSFEDLSVGSCRGKNI
jgi:hypothetical protein